jgi:hypothetical protein
MRLSHLEPEVQTNGTVTILNENRTNCERPSNKVQQRSTLYETRSRAWTSSLRQTKLHAIPRSLSAASPLLQNNASACNPIMYPSIQGQGRIGMEDGSDPSLQPAAPAFAALIAPAQTEASTKLVPAPVLNWYQCSTSPVKLRTSPGTKPRLKVNLFRICDQCRNDPELIREQIGSGSSSYLLDTT